MKIFALLIFVSIAICTKAQNPGSLPDSIKSYTLLVMKAEKGIAQKLYNKKIEDAFSSTYKGAFELVGKKDLDDPKYADLTKYRYTVNHYQTGSTRHSERKPNGQYVEKDIPIFDVVIYDRLMKKELNRPGIQTSTYIDAMRQLGKLLEKNSE